MEYSKDSIPGIDHPMSQTVTSALQCISAAWARKDAHACAGAFATTGELVTEHGDEVRTHADIERYYSNALLGAFGDTDIVFHSTEGSSLSDSTCVLGGTVLEFVQGAVSVRALRVTLILALIDGRWLIRRWHATDMYRRNAAERALTWRAAGEAVLCAAGVAVYSVAVPDFRRFSRGALAALLGGTAFLVLMQLRSTCRPGS